MSYPLLFPKNPKDATAARAAFRDHAAAYDWISIHTCPECGAAFDLYCDVTHDRDRSRTEVPCRLEEDHAQGHSAPFIQFDYLPKSVQFKVIPLGA
jgi:hypothetical protein